MDVLDVLLKLKQSGHAMVHAEEVSAAQWQQWLAQRSQLISEIDDINALASDEDRSLVVTLVRDIQQIDAEIIARAEAQLGALRRQMSAASSMRRFLSQDETRPSARLFVKVA